MALSDAQIYNGDGSTRDFTILGEILSESHLRVWIDDVLQSSDDWDLLGNTVLFNDAPDDGANVQFLVSTTGTDFPSNPSAIGDVSININDVITVAANIGIINTTSTNINDVIAVSSNIDNVNWVASNKTNIDNVVNNKTNIDTVSTNINDVTTVADDTVAINEIYNNRLEIYEADNNAIIATNKASEASTSASNAQLSVWEAKAEAMTSESYATEAVDVFVKEYTSNGDGTFSSTNTTDYSASHWAYKAKVDAQGDIIETDKILLRKTSGGITTITGIDGTGFTDLQIPESGVLATTDSPAFTGTPTAPTATVGDNSTQLATTAFVTLAVANPDVYQGAYGFNWDYSSDTYLRTGAAGYTSIQAMMKRCVLNVNGTVNYYLHPTNSNFKADGTPSVLTGADGNVMVEVPKFYAKIETVGNVNKYSISLTPDVGYVVHPWFVKAGVEVDYRYYRAYTGYNSGGRLKSISGVTPTSAQTIATFRSQAVANGTGWHLTDWNAVNAIKLLCYIEFNDYIVTDYIGTGNDTGTDYGLTTGQSNAIGNASSPSTNNNMWMSYRGIENFYADCWEFLDGVNINNYVFYVNQNYTTFASDVFTGDYVSKGTTIASSASYITRCSVSVSGGWVPSVIGGASTTYYGDGLWSATGARVALFGGNTSDGTVAGVGTLSVAGASSVSGAIIGGAVCF